MAISSTAISAAAIDGSRTNASKKVHVDPYIATAGSDQAGIQAAVDAATADAKIVFGARNYNIGTGIYVDVTGGVNLEGDGVFGTILTFTPTLDGQIALRIGNDYPTAQNTLCRVANIGITTADTTYDKTALQLDAVSSFHGENLYISGFYGAGTDSVGVHFYGHETSQLKSCKIAALVPIRLSVDAVAGHSELSADMFHFEDVYLLSATAQSPATLIKAGILIDEDVYFSNFTVDGACVAVLTDYGIYHKTDAANLPLSVGTGVNIKGFRHEQSTDSAAYNIYLNYAAGRDLQNLVLDGVKFNTTCNGLFVDAVHNVVAIGCHFPQGAGQSGWNINNTYSFSLISCYEISTAVNTIDDNMVLVWGTPHRNGYNYPNTAFYAYQAYALSAGNYTFTSQKPVKLMGGAHEWTWAGTLGDDNYVLIPICSDQSAVVGIVDVAASDGSAAAECGRWLLSTSSVGTKGCLLLTTASTTNCAETDSDTDLCVYGNGATDLLAPVYVKNRLGVSCTVVVRVTYKRSLET